MAKALAETALQLPQDEGLWARCVADRSEGLVFGELLGEFYVDCAVGCYVFFLRVAL